MEQKSNETDMGLRQVEIEMGHAKMAQTKALNTTKRKRISRVRPPLTPPHKSSKSGH